jgi:hypothetical protein
MPPFPGSLPVSSMMLTPTPSREAMSSLMESERQKRLAEERARMDAAVLAARGFEDPRGQGSGQKVPAPTTTVKAPAVGTGPGAASERPVKAEAAAEVPAGDPYYSGVKAVKTADGRITWAGPDEALAQARAGGNYVNYDRAVVEGSGTQGGGPRSDPRLGSDIVRGSEGSTFTQQGATPNLTEGTSPTASKPYSAKVRELVSQGPAPDLKDPGTAWTFTGGVGTGAPREGVRQLSGLEQATSRRAWLEGRADEEQATELARDKMGLESALVEQRLRQAELPPPDPLELKRIEAEGRYGDALIRARSDQSARGEASRVYDAYSRQIEEARQMLAQADPGSQNAAELKEYIDALIRERMERANVAAGFVLRDPRADPFAAIAGAIANRPPAASGTGER